MICQFFSHSKTNTLGKVLGSKHLKAHIEGVLDKALHHYAPNVDLGISDGELRRLLRVIVVFHDLGKYTSFFQNYLLKREPIDSLLKQHSRIGGFAAYNTFKDLDEKQALLALYVIFQHHSQLISIVAITEKLNDDLKRIIACQQEDISRVLSCIQSDLTIADISKVINYPEERPIRSGLKRLAIQNSSIQDYFLINYLYSLLIEADKLDASDTQIYHLKELEANSVDKRFGEPKQFNGDVDLKRLTNDEVRNFCRAQIVANLEKPDILNRFIFTLTAPTGVGKTMSALDFALRLKAKMRRELGVEARIIYALPFINIIEQAYIEYKETLPADVKVLAHYQYADVFGDGTETEDENEENINYNQRLMTLDTWQADIVITSFVQFFETLIGNRNKLLKKFNHLANAIIIIDEVQTLRLDQMPLIGATLFYLTKFMKARVIMMTATKPKIFELAQTQILSTQGESAIPLELLECHQSVFAAFKRTKVVPLLGIDLGGENAADSFVNKVFLEKWQPGKSCLIVCNTVTRSIEVYHAIVSILRSRDLINTVEYLSTNIVPAHRLDRIKALKEHLISGNAPILVSTQVVEAGVDLDFDMGFRDLGPIDSIIQVAGRVNRNNDVKRSHSPLYVVDFGDAQRIYGRITKEQVKSALQAKYEFHESDYLDMVDRYFDDVSDKKSFSRFNGIFDAMRTLRYDDKGKNDTVSSFRIIEESFGSQSVYVEMDDYATELRERYLEKILRKLGQEEFDRRFKLDFQQRIISIPEYLTNELPAINEFDDKIKVVTRDRVEQYYEQRTGFVRRQHEVVTFL